MSTTFLLLLFSAVAVAVVGSVDVLQTLTSNDVFNDLKIGAPLKLDLLAVSFDGKDLLVPGQKFSKDEVANEPTVSFTGAEDSALYTLLMVDPDAPSRENPLRRSWLHWMVVNVHGSDLKSGEVACGFNPSTPPPNSGFHRYVFLLFKQSGNLNDVEACSNRGSFDAADFVAKSKLDELVAANFYEARNEPL